MKKIFLLFSLLVLFMFGCINECQASSSRELVKAAEKGDFEKVQLLVEGGADVNGKSSILQMGTTALMVASYYNHYEIVKYLIENGADVNAKDGNGHTALMFAGYRNINLENENKILKLLIANGADLNCRSKYGDTALTFNRHYNRVDILLKAGIDPNIEDNEGHTALWHYRDLRDASILIMQYGGIMK